MRVLVCGSTGCVGHAVAQALRAHGHSVVEGCRQAPRDATHMHIDYTAGWSAEEWARRLVEAGGFDAVVNAVGILMPKGSQTFERIHASAPAALFTGAAKAGVRRVVQISALGVSGDSDGLRTPYAMSKLQADEALLALAQSGAIDAVVVRPSLIYGPRSQSAALFRTLAKLPVVSLPGGGQQPVQPIHVFELAEAVCRMLEHPQRIGRVVEMAGPQVLTYQEMLATYRRTMGLADPIWLPVPMRLMRVGAHLATLLPQQVFSPDTMTMLEHGNSTQRNGAAEWLGRAPTAMAEALRLPDDDAGPG